MPICVSWRICQHNLCNQGSPYSWRVSGLRKPTHFSSFDNPLCRGQSSHISCNSCPTCFVDLVRHGSSPFFGRVLECFRFPVESLSYLCETERIDLLCLGLKNICPFDMLLLVLTWFSSTNKIDWRSKKGGFSLAKIFILIGSNCCVRPPKHTCTISSSLRFMFVEISSSTRFS